MKTTSAVLEEINERTGLFLELCDSFPGFRQLGNEIYFNVLLPCKISESKEYEILVGYSKKYKSFRVEPNGVKRASLIFKSKFN